MEYDLKNEEDVKEFLDKLGIEYRFTCFSEKKPESCHLLGEYLQNIKSDSERAMKIFKTNCDDHNYARSCSKYAQLAYKGKGTKAAQKEAVTYYDKGCQAGYSNACTSGGIICLMEARKATELQQRSDLQKKGAELIHSGCELNNDFACFREATFYLAEKSELGYPQDLKKAFKLSEKACQLGNIESCANLSLMYKKGDGVEQDLTKSDFYKKKAMSIQQQYDEHLSMGR